MRPAWDGLSSIESSRCARSRNFAIVQFLCPFTSPSEAFTIRTHKESTLSRSSSESHPGWSFGPLSRCAVRRQPPAQAAYSTNWSLSSPRIRELRITFETHFLCRARPSTSPLAGIGWLFVTRFFRGAVSLARGARFFVSFLLFSRLVPQRPP